MSGTKEDKTMQRVITIFLILCYLPYIAIIPAMAKNVIIYPIEKMTSTYNEAAGVIDSAGILSPDDETMLLKSFSEFKETTGVAIKFITLEYNVWEQENIPYEQYAESLYKDYFKDDKGWVIVYSKSPQYDDMWKWADIKGTDTNAFIREAAPYLSQDVRETIGGKNEYTLAEAICYAFDKATFDFSNQEIEFNAEEALPISIMLAVLIVHSSIMFAVVFKKKSRLNKRILPAHVLYAEMEAQQRRENVRFGNKVEIKRGGNDIVGVDGECQFCKTRFNNVTDGKCPNCGSQIKQDHICWE